jgi:hypothetical protein
LTCNRQIFSLALHAALLELHSFYNAEHALELKLAREKLLSQWRRAQMKTNIASSDLELISQIRSDFSSSTPTCATGLNTVISLRHRARRDNMGCYFVMHLACI